MNLLKYAEEHLMAKRNIPAFKAGDSVTVSYKIKEGDKERVQQFSGIVIQCKGHGNSSSFTVRKLSNGVGVERVFPLFSPFIEAISVDKRGEVRRARLYYLRNAIGKKAKVDELKSDDDHAGGNASASTPAAQTPPAKQTVEA